MSKAEPGTVIHGTMRAQDLIPAFLIVLRKHNRGLAETIIRDIPHDELVLEDKHHRIRFWLESSLNEDHPWWNSYAASCLITGGPGYGDTLFHALQTIAPEGHYFGTREDDHNNFGFWPSQEPRYSKWDIPFRE